MKSYQLAFCTVLASLGASQTAMAATNWVKGSYGYVSYDAIVYGHESNQAKLYLCRAMHGKGLHPGKAAPHLGACNIGYGGNEIAVKEYEYAVPAWSPNKEKGEIPSDAIVAAYEKGQARFFCRAEYGGNFHPGKIGPGFGGCNIPYGGKEIRVEKYEVLVRGDDHPYDDVPYELSGPFSDGKVPFDAIVGGKEAGENFYLCLGKHANSLHPGKVRAGLGACNIPYGGAEIAIKKDYRVLKAASLPSSESAAWRYPVGYELGRDLFSCRAWHANGWHPGKTWIGLDRCLIPYGGKELSKPQYQLLDERFGW